MFQGLAQMRLNGGQPFDDPVIDALSATFNSLAILAGKITAAVVAFSALLKAVGV